jgi:hypothetical protein
MLMAAERIEDALQELGHHLAIAPRVDPVRDPPAA